MGKFTFHRNPLNLLICLFRKQILLRLFSVSMVQKNKVFCLWGAVMNGFDIDRQTQHIHDHIIHTNRVEDSSFHYSHIISNNHPPSYLDSRSFLEHSKQYSSILILFHFRVPIQWCGKSPSIRFCISRRYFTYGWIWKNKIYAKSVKNA